jgi:iron complex transport system ATP-binding protein
MQGDPVAAQYITEIESGVREASRMAARSVKVG